MSFSKAYFLDKIFMVQNVQTLFFQFHLNCDLYYDGSHYGNEHDNNNETNFNIHIESAAGQMKNETLKNCFQFFVSAIN